MLFHLIIIIIRKIEKRGMFATIQTKTAMKFASVAMG
jgi:hypothetical protein